MEGSLKSVGHKILFAGNIGGSSFWKKIDSFYICQQRKENNTINPVLERNTYCILSFFRGKTALRSALAKPRPREKDSPAEGAGGAGFTMEPHRLLSSIRPNTGFNPFHGPASFSYTLK